MTDHLEVIERIRDESMNGCGCSYEFFVSKFSGAIDQHAANLPETERQSFIETAKVGGDYATPEELAETMEGCCPHGIEWGCCPAGCE